MGYFSDFSVKYPNLIRGVFQMIKFITNIFKTLNSNSHPKEIAHAICCGMLLGFMPKTNALWYVLFFIFCFLRINKACYLLFTILFSMITPFLDPIFDKIGFAILSYEPLIPTYIKMLEIPYLPLTRFNNTIVMGSLASGIVLYIPVYIIARLIVRLWRSVIRQAFVNSKLVKAFYKIPLISKFISVSKELSK